MDKILITFIVCFVLWAVLSLMYPIPEKVFNAIMTTVISGCAILVLLFAWGVI